MDRKSLGTRAPPGGRQNLDWPSEADFKSSHLYIVLAPAARPIRCFADAQTQDAWAAPGLEIKAIAAYKGPALPNDEDERMRTVCCAVQNDQDDPVLSSICKLVCSLLRVPTAAVSIVEKSRQYLKSAHGSQRNIIPRSMSFCQFTFLTRLPVVLVVEDALEDERFANNPLVNNNQNPIRFYAGAPLIASNGKRLGALCLMDTKPRKMTAEDYRVLNSCAEMVVRRLEAATHTEVAKLGTNSLLRTLNAFKQAIFLCDVASRGWPVLHANAAMLERLGMRSDAEISKVSVWQLFQAAPESEEQVREGFMEHTSQMQRFSVWLQLKDKAHSPTFQIMFKPATEGSLDPYTPHIEVPDTIPKNASAAQDLPYYFAIIQSTKPAEGAAQALPNATTEAWRQNFKPLDEGLQTTPKLDSIPDMAPADSAHISQGQDAKTSADAEMAASFANEGVGKAPNGARESEGGTSANPGSQQLAPAKSGKLESKERISSMLHPIGKDSAMEGVNAEAKGSKKMGCFGGRGHAKESSKPCVIF